MRRLPGCRGRGPALAFDLRRSIAIPSRRGRASRGGDPIVLYWRKDGSVAPYYAKKVKAKQALFHASYSGVTYAEARKQLLKDAAKASGKTKAFLADAAKADASPAKEAVAAK